MATVFMVQSDVEGAIPPVRAFPTEEAAIQHVGDIVEEYRDVFAPKRVEVDEESFDPREEHGHGLCRRMVIKIVNDPDSVEQAFTFSIYQNYLLFNDGVDEVPYSDDPPTEPGYYCVLYELRNDDTGNVIGSGSELCEISTHCNGAGVRTLMAKSLLLETVSPTDREGVECHDRSLKSLCKVPGLHMQWRRLVPETQTKKKKAKKR